MDVSPAVSHWHGRKAVSTGYRYIPPGHARHEDIAEHEVHRFGLAPGQSSGPVKGFDHDVPFRDEELLEHVAQVGVRTWASQTVATS